VDQGNWNIYRMDADGSNMMRLTDNSDTDGDSIWLSDGQTILFCSGPESAGAIYIFAMNADGTNRHRLTQFWNDEWLPALSPDGQQLVFSSDESGALSLYTMNIDGSGMRQLSYGNNDHDPVWQPIPTRR
jgi:Tol biopolymer transport system component